MDCFIIAALVEEQTTVIGFVSGVEASCHADYLEDKAVLWTQWITRAFMRHVGMCAEETHTFIYIKNMAFGTGFDNNGEEQPKDQLQ